MYMDKMSTMRRLWLGLVLLQQFANRLLGGAQNFSSHKNIFGLLWQIPFRTAHTSLICAGLVLTPVGHSKAAITTFYSATQVDVIPMGTTRRVRAVNDNGDIAGTIRNEDHRGPSGMIWHKDGSTKIINNDKHAEITGSQGVGLLDNEDYSTATDINNNLQVVGATNTATGMRALRHGPGGNAVFLEMPPGDTGSEALAINHFGKIAGWSSGPDGIRAVIWSQVGEVQILPELPGSKSCRAQAINNSGDVVGTCNTVSGSRAVLWSVDSDKTVLDLGTLPGDSWSEASGINNKGDVVGTSGHMKGQYHAVIWRKGDTIEDLGTLTSRQTSSKALAINNKGEVVGILEHNDGGYISGERAFIWTEQRGMEDLNDLVLSSSDFVLSHAIAISNRGLIIAIGRHLDPDTEGHAHSTHEIPLQIFRLSPRLGGSK